MRKMILTVAAVAVVAASARAQVLQAPAGQAYTIINTASATAVNVITYQWYRNNNPIAGATRESYTVPRTLAYGENVQFYRLAKTEDCTGEVEKKSNVITITFIGYTMPPEGCNLIIGGICWANYNVDNPQTFATRADMPTKFYQWNRLTAYSATEPLTPAWNVTVDQSETWTVNPCPPNWRIPSRDEYQQLHNSGSTWANANTRGNQIFGRFYGYNHATCTLPSSMDGCVFFPAHGDRHAADGALINENGGYAWSNTEANNSNDAYFLSFNSVSSNPNENNAKTFGFPIRCVR